jgi:hypothetical protein
MAKSKIFKTEVNSIPAGGQWECQLELDGEACGIIISNDAQLMHPNAQHFWDIHPASCFGGIHLHNLVTGEDVLPMEDFEPLDDWTVRFLKSILPAAVADFRKPQFLSARDFIRNYTGSKDNLADAVAGRGLGKLLQFSAGHALFADGPEGIVSQCLIRKSKHQPHVLSCSTMILIHNVPSYFGIEGTLREFGCLGAKRKQPRKGADAPCIIGVKFVDCFTRNYDGGR